jgi:hypothetical protein
MVVPVAVESRYLILVVPVAVVAAAPGIIKLVQFAVTRRPGIGRLAWLAPALLLANVALTLRIPHDAPRVLTPLAHEIMAQPSGNPFVLAVSNAHGEGALIAAFTALDRARVHYVIKASSVLAETDFNGFLYRERFPDAPALLAWIRDNRVGWMVLDSRPEAQAMVHVQRLLALADAGQEAWELVATRGTPTGDVRLFRLDRSAPTDAEVAAVVRQLLPLRAAGVMETDRR